MILVLVDDMGFSDLGCYGGEIETPNLDALAAGGIRFTNFYNTGRCWPTRASLLTGRYPHAAGHAMMFGPDAPPGYRGTTREVAPMLPELLKPAGYRCYHVGKWHLDSAGRPRSETGPLARGFDRSLCFQRQDNHFNPLLVFDEDRRIERPAGDSAFGDGAFYSTTVMTARAIEFLAEHVATRESSPFLLYLAYTAPHFPLHALPADIARFRGRYREGWDSVRARRLERLRDAGIVDCDLPPRDPDAPDWESLTDDAKDAWDTRMAIHAAMVHRVDAALGELFSFLREHRRWDDTLVLFLSDNGASAEFIVRGDGHDPAAPPGSGATYQCLEVGWANAANTPFRLHKIWVHEGGIATPLIAHWPAGIPESRVGGFVREDGHVIDVVPTVLHAAGIKAADADTGHDVVGRPGMSLLPLLRGNAREPHPFLFWEHFGNRAIKRGPWKLVAEFGRPWELYRLDRDRSELRDLADRMPDLVRELAALWQRTADAVGVVDWSEFPQSNYEPTEEYRRK